MKANRGLKNSLFSFLFSDTDVLRELCSALEGVSLPDDIPITINTLKNILTKGRYNDISFEIGGRLVVLIEHQSTINPNMALRLLMYIGRLYERLIDDRELYASKRVAIPRPEFFVLYNGKDPFPDERIYRLSDAFLDPCELGTADSGGPAMELTVKVLNINQGRNEGIARKSKILAEYQAFIAKVRECEKQGNDLEGAIRKAILYCRDHDILKEFLKRHAREVINMLLHEWNMDTALAVRFEEGMERGIEQGMRDVALNALDEGLPLEVVQKITGLDIETIENLRGQQP
jgi:hypothetical protein